MRRERRREKRRWPWALLAWMALSCAFAAQGRLASPGSGWAFRPDLLACLLVHAAWRLGPRASAVSAAALALAVWPSTLEPFSMLLLRFGALAVAARVAARWLDVSHWLTQPVAAALALVCAEAFAALASLLFFGEAAWPPLSSMLATSAAVGVFHWPIERFVSELRPSRR